MFDVLLLDSVTQAISTSSTVQQLMFKSIEDEHVKHDLSEFLNAPILNLHCAPSSRAMCSAAICEKRRLLVLNLNMMLLKIVILGSESDANYLKITIRLIDQSSRLGAQHFLCLHDTTASLRSEPLAELKVANPVILTDYPGSWQQKLSTEIDALNAQQRLSMSRAVASICHELEERCSDIEAPVRKEKEKLQELQIQHEGLRQEADRLRTHAESQNQEIQSLQEELLKSNDQIAEAGRTKKDLRAKIEELEFRFAKLREESLKAFSEAENEKENKIMNLCTLLSCKEDDATRQGQQIRSLKIEQENLQEGLRRLRDEKLAERREQQLSLAHIEKLEHDLDAVNLLLVERDHKINDVMGQKKNLEESLAEMSRDLQHSSKCLQDTSNKCNELNLETVALGAERTAMEARLREAAAKVFSGNRCNLAAYAKWKQVIETENFLHIKTAEADEATVNFEQAQRDFLDRLRLQQAEINDLQIEVSFVKQEKICEANLSIACRSQSYKNDARLKRRSYTTSGL